MEDEAIKKCQNCGKKVSSHARFCSVCGTALANFCPNCGQAHVENARFCANCGYAFVGEEVTPARQPSVVVPVAKKTEKPTKEKTETGRLGKVLRVIPAVLFALFAVLTFVFYCAPMVKMPLIGGLGNLYQFMGGDEALKMFGLQGLAITYFLVSVAILGLSVIYLVAVTPYGRRMRARNELFLSDVLSWLVIIVYVTFIVISIMVMSTLAKEKMELSSSVATLVLVFSIIFALLSGTCNVLGFTRFGARWAMPPKMQQPVPPTAPVIAQIKEEGELESVTAKYLQSTRKTAKFVVWMLFFAVYPMFGVVMFKIFQGIPSIVDNTILYLLVFMVTILGVLGLPIIISLGMKKIASALKPYRIYRIITSNRVKRWAIFIGVVLGLWTIEAIGITCAILLTGMEEDSDIVFNIAMIVSFWIFELCCLCAFCSLLGLRNKRKKTLNHPAVKPICDLCTYKNLAEMSLYLKAVKRYAKEEKLYAFYLYDIEKHEKYLEYYEIA